MRVTIGRQPIQVRVGNSVIVSADAAALAMLDAKVSTADLASTASGKGAAMVGFKQSGTGAAARTLQDKARDTVSVKDFGAVGDGTTDDTAAVQAALTAATGSDLWFPSGTYMCGPITVPAGTHPRGSGTLKKNANGDWIMLAERSTITDLTLDAQGATYTGRGVLISTGPATIDNANDIYWRKLVRVKFLNFAEYPVEFTTARAGYGTTIESCRFTLVGANRYVIGCVKFPNGESAVLNGNRFMIACWTFGYRMFDAGECDNLTVIGCQGAAPILNPNSLKISMIGGRVVNVGDGSLTSWVIDGEFGSYDGMIVGLDVSFAATCNQVQWAPASMSGSVTSDAAPGSTVNNNISYGPITTFTPAWMGGGSPAIGNGTLSSGYSRRGFNCAFRMTLEIGSTTTIPTGAWTFSLPFQCSRFSIGKVWIQNAAGAVLFQGAALAQSGSSTFQMITNEASNALVGQVHPFAWATGDKMYVEFEYPIT